MQCRFINMMVLLTIIWISILVLTPRGIKNKESSKVKDCFHVIFFDNPATPQNEFDYKGWWNAKSLPQFNRTKNDLNPGPKHYIFNATKRWMDPDGNGNY